VIESVESTLGIPDPEEFAKEIHEDEKSEQKTDTVVLDEPTAPDNKTQHSMDDNGKGKQTFFFGTSIYISHIHTCDMK